MYICIYPVCSFRTHWAHPGRQRRQVPATKRASTPPAMPATLTLMLMTFPSSLPPTHHNDAIRSVVVFLFFFFFFCCNSSHLVLLLPAGAARRVPPPSPQPPVTQCLVFNFSFICCNYPASLVAAAASSGRNDWSFCWSF